MLTHRPRRIVDSSRYWETLGSDPKLSDQEAIGTTQPSRFVAAPFKSPARSILDAGAGYGRFTIPFASSGKRAVALELSRSMIVRLKSNLGHNCDMVDIVRADVRSIPFRSSTFDAAICWGVIYCIPKKSQEIVVSQLSACLRNGGELILQTKTIGSVLRSKRYVFGLAFVLAYGLLLIRRAFNYAILKNIELEGRFEYRSTKGSIVRLVRKYFREVCVENESHSGFLVIRAFH